MLDTVNPQEGRHSRTDKAWVWTPCQVAGEVDVLAAADALLGRWDKEGATVAGIAVLDSAVLEAGRRLSTPTVSTRVADAAVEIAGERPGELVRLVDREPVGRQMDARLGSRKRTSLVPAGCRTSTLADGAWADRRLVGVVAGIAVRKEYGS